MIHHPNCRPDHPPPHRDQVRDRSAAREGARYEKGAAGTPSLVCCHKNSNETYHQLSPKLTSIAIKISIKIVITIT